MNYGKTLKDRIWLWGQSPDSHWQYENVYNLPGHSRMSAVEGCLYFGIDNICRVRMLGHPQPPYDQESEAMRPCKRVIWSLLGAGAEPVTEWGDVDEVIRQSKIYPNIVGGIFDDFFNVPERIKFYLPPRLKAIRERLCEGAGKHLDMWVVLYEFMMDLVPNLEGYLNEFDVITFWTWRGREIPNIRTNIDRIRKMAPGKKIMAGCYMWNYGEKCPLTIEQMQEQCNTYLELVKEGVIEGIIVCSNCIADLGIECVEWMRNWINEHKDIVIER